MTKSFDVFLSHNSKDKPAVRELAEALRARGLKVWLDEWELVPGRLWQEALEEVIETCRSSAVLIGKDGLGPWHATEMRGCLTEFVRRKLPVIPVLLPGAPAEPSLPLLLTQVTWVDLKGGLTEEGLDQLQWGITGERPDRLSPPTTPAPAPEAVPAAPTEFAEEQSASAESIPELRELEAPAAVAREQPDQETRREPAIVVQHSVLSDAYRRFVTALNSTASAEAAALQSSAMRIEKAITKQNETHFRAAYLALLDRDRPSAVSALRMGLSLDETNGPAWSVYASLLALAGNHDRTREVFDQIAQWFGPNCPALPTEIRDAFRANARITVISPRPIEIIVQAAFGNAVLNSIAVSTAGLAAAYLHDTWGRKPNETELCVSFAPWLPPADRKFDWDSGSRGYMDSSWRKDRRTITAMTGRFVVLNNDTILDMAENFACKRINPVIAAASFAVGEGLVPVEVGQHRDVELTIIPGSGYEFFSLAPMVNPKVIAKPRFIVDSLPSRPTRHTP